MTTSSCANHCACCAGVSARTPIRINNAPGLSTIRYRSGVHPHFLASMQARLSDAAYPALHGLRTRAPRDFSMALLDVFAACADVLTFYQERIATESYLRTATERRSMVELGRLVGYRPKPGVAAETYLSFSMQQGVGTPDSIRLEAGIKVQSIPGPGEVPQTFETIEAIDARSAWMDLRAETSTPHLPVTTDCYLQGVGLNLRVGDVLLFVGEEATTDIARDNWDVRTIEVVRTDNELGLTYVGWSTPLGSVFPPVAPAANPQVHVFRTRGAVFGHNAPHWRSMPLSYRTDYSTPTAASGTEWPNFQISPVSGAVDFDQVHQGVTSDSWVSLMKPDYIELFRVTEVTELSRAEFSVSGKVTRAMLAGENYALFASAVRETTVLANNEQLKFARRPVVPPVFGLSLVLGSEVDGLAIGQRLALAGPRAHLRVTASGQTRDFTTAAGTRRLVIDEVLEVLSPPVRVIGGTALPATPVQARTLPVRWAVRDDQGRTGVVEARLGELVLSTPPLDAEVVSEVVQIEPIDGAISVGDGRTLVDLDVAMQHCYSPDGLSINANVAAATHGESVVQVLGSGNAGRTHQRFGLRQLPVTFVGDDTESGVASSVQVFVNDARWEERSTLLEAGPGDHAFALRVDGESTAVVQFGDGIHGSRLPTGRENVLARYRRGIGSGGNLKANQISQLLSRPLGLSGATNPAAANGGVDPESADEAREQIPRGVRTLGRAVSLRDYEDFALAYPGVAKAHVAVLNLRAGRTIFVTVAGEDGTSIPQDDPILMRLVASLRSSGDPHVRFEVMSYVPTTFNVRMRVKLRPGHTRTEVFERIEADLHDQFGFDARAFAQPVPMSAVIAAADAVEGVEAVDLEHLYRGVTPMSSTRLSAATSQADAVGRGVPAELLTLAEGPLAWLGEMP